MVFQSKYINTSEHHLLGFLWNFRGCKVEMQADGFVCNCLKRPRTKCKHITSVELGILGVNSKEYSI